MRQYEVTHNGCIISIAGKSAHARCCVDNINDYLLAAVAILPDLTRRRNRQTHVQACKLGHACISIVASLAGTKPFINFPSLFSAHAQHSQFKDCHADCNVPKQLLSSQATLYSIGCRWAVNSRYRIIDIHLMTTLTQNQMTSQHGTLLGWSPADAWYY